MNENKKSILFLINGLGVASKDSFDIKFNDIKYKHLYGWVFKNVRILKEPIPYNHKQGCVIWVNLDDKFKEMI